MSGGLTIRVAKRKDFLRYYGTPAPKTFTAMVGERGGEIVAIGGVFYDGGTAMGFLDAKERPALSLHRTAVKFMKTMKAVGEPAIYTACEDTIPRAADWLLRLGFKMTPDTVDGQRIWRWKPE